MSLRINTNLASLNAQTRLAKQQGKVEHAQARLASGNRITKASDDAAGLAISEQMRGQLAGLGKAKENAMNAMSLMQVGEGALNETSNMVIRMRELAVQSASDTISDKERNFLNQEMQQLQQEVDRIAQSTKFGDKTLLDGSADDMDFQVGPNAGKENVISFKTSMDATADGIGVEGLDLSDKDGAKDALGAIDDSLTKISEMRANYGAISSRLERTSNNLATQFENVSAAKSRISDADIAEESAKLTSAQVLQSAATSVLASSNQNSAAALRLIG